MNTRLLSGKRQQTIEKQMENDLTSHQNLPFKQKHKF